MLDQNMTIVNFHPSAHHKKLTKDIPFTKQVLNPFFSCSNAILYDWVDQCSKTNLQFGCSDVQVNILLIDKLHFNCENTVVAVSVVLQYICIFSLAFSKCTEQL